MSNMSEGDVALLKEALFKQYVIMKKLFAELDEERDASASAASEALSMILRLQREKAAEKMEASQYRRMAEEKISHAEECMMILEEVIQQKEFEISVLKDQVQKYKKKLLSIGLNDIEFENDPSTSTSSKNAGLTGIHSYIRRTASLPLLKFDKSLTEMISSNEDSSLPLKEGKQIKIPRPESVKYEPSSGRSVNQATGSICKSLVDLSISSWHSTLSSNTSCHSAIGDHKICLDREAALNIVPECYEKIYNSSGGVTDKEEKVLVPLGREGSRSNSSPARKISFARQALKLSIPMKDCSQYYNCEDIVPTPRDDLEQIKTRLQQLEGEKMMKMKDTESGSERLKLLRDIYEQLNMIENRLNASVSKNRPTQEDTTIVSITEAILSFAI